MSVFQITLQNRTRDGYPVVVQYSQADRFEVRAEGRVPMDEDFILDLATCDDPAAYGRMLGEALFQGRIRDAFSRARAGSEDRLHVLLCVEATELRALRWERLQAPIDAANACAAASPMASASAVSPMLSSSSTPTMRARDAPSVRAASSTRPSSWRSAASSVITRHGMATKVCATITAVVVNGRR